jgi:hypothetical protein
VRRRIPAFPSGSSVVWYGYDHGGACDYNTGSPNSGALILNSWIVLPVGAASISLRYWSLTDTENCLEGYDIHRVLVHSQAGATLSVPFRASGNSDYFPWNERRADLTHSPAKASDSNSASARSTTRVADGCSTTCVSWSSPA